MNLTNMLGKKEDNEMKHIVFYAIYLNFKK